MFFESTRVSADVLLEAAGVGAGLALRVRNDRIGSSPAYFRGGVRGLFLYLGALPAQDEQSTAGRVNPGGLPPMASRVLGGWALCADSYCHTPLVEGDLPASSPPLTAHWHAVALEVTHDLARGTVDQTTIFEGVAVGSTLPSPAAVAQCASNTIVWRDRVIAGGDYKQLPANTSSADPKGVAGCTHACCADTECTAWAVAAGKCWLKNGGVVEHRSGEDACGFKPSSSRTADVPPSGWAALAATLGPSQFDNFALTGTARGGAAATPCAAVAPHAGAQLASTPCDFPGALTSFGASAAADGALQLRSSSGLCIGHAGANITLVPCGSSSALVFDEPTGRITPTSPTATACLTAVQRQHVDPAPPPLAFADCSELPNSAQQFQWNPSTGALRQKGAHCIAAFPSDVAQYRDCCIALCAAA